MATLKYKGQEIDIDAQLRELDRYDCEQSLHYFLKKAWRYIDSASFVDGWALGAISEHLEAVVDGEIKRLIINQPPRTSKSTVTSVAFPAWVWAQSYLGPTSGPGVPILHASYAHSLALRDSVKRRRLISSPWYKSLWGDRFTITPDQNQKIRFQNTKGGESLITSVDAGVTGEGANIIVVDDANNAKEALSEAVIQSTNEDWWDGTMSTRLNDPKTGAIIVVQQRLGERDLTGHILEREPEEWVHLMLPMRYEAARSYVTVIDWKDPRTEEGELLWPERFGEPEVAKLENNLRKWRCSPGEAPILMSDLTQKRIDQIKIGDEIIGFTKRPTMEGRKYGRYRLAKSTVTEVHSFVAPVVRMTLDTGAVIRCTPDHRWFTKDRGPIRENYHPAKVGSYLSRICPAKLPTLTAHEERAAGWLAGFFDGEGSVTEQRRKNGYAPGGTICFYQGSGRNLPLCNKLEETLIHFGFPFTVSEDERKPNKDAPCYGYRCYRLKGEGLPTYQRFLHLVQPTKWRDRFIDAAYKSNFIKGREKVVKIEPDGEEVVYGLTTSTGNYIVWGLASANSAGQLQQRPEPAGGGIIKREWWNLWPPESEEKDNLGRVIKIAPFPPMEYIVASLDTAYTEKTMNDPSALTIWGVFASSKSVAVANKQIMRDGSVFEQPNSILHPNTAPAVMLMHAWQGHLELHPLVEQINKLCKSHKVDLLIIENKAAGHSVAQELRRLFSATADYTVQLNDPKGMDKIGRLYSVQHVFEDGMVFAPDRSWAEDVISQMATFPNAQHDDLVDTCVIGNTLVLMSDGTHRAISDVRVGQMVQTPLGPRRVLESACTGVKPIWRVRWNGGELAATGSHPVYVAGQWKRLDGLRACDTLSSWHGKPNPELLSSPSTSTDTNTIGTPTPAKLTIGNTLLAAAENCFTAISGNTIADPYPSVGKSTTRTKILSTIECETSFACRLKNIAKSMRTCIENVIVRRLSSLISTVFGVKLRSGIDLPQDRHGTDNTIVTSVKELHVDLPVYNLRVAEAECYYANGILVHNCSQGLRHLRDRGMLSRAEEMRGELESGMEFTGRPLAPLYPA